MSLDPYNLPTLFTPVNWPHYLTRGLVVWYALNDAATPIAYSRGRRAGRGASLYSGVSPGNKFPCLRRPGGLYFDGSSNAYGSITTGDAGPTLRGKTQATVSAWVSCASYTDSRYVYTEQTGSVGYGRLSLYVDTSGMTRLIIRDSTRDPTGTFVATIGATSLPLGQASHIAGTWNSDTDITRIYVNGMLDVTKTDTTYSGFADTAPAKITLGAAFNSSSVLIYPMLGTIADVRVWDRELSEAEIRELYRL